VPGVGRHLVKQDKRDRVRADAQRALVRASELALNADDHKYFADRAEDVHWCGFLRGYRCGCGQEYGKAPDRACHLRVCPFCSAARCAVLLDRVDVRLDQLDAAAGDGGGVLGPAAEPGARGLQAPSPGAGGLDRPPGAAFTPVMVTLTQPGNAGRSLLDAFDALDAALTKLHRTRAWFCAELSGRDVSGGYLTSIEVKRGEGHRYWHVHAHTLVVLPGGWSAEGVESWGRELVDSWLRIVPGASDEAQDVQLADRRALAEVIKYSVKTSSIVSDRDLDDAARDIADVMKLLRKRRFLRTGGCLRGVDKDVENDGEQLEDEVSDQVPACIVCGGEHAITEAREVLPDPAGQPDWYPELTRPTVIPRGHCLPLPGHRGWYVRVVDRPLERGSPISWAIPRLPLAQLVAELDGRYRELKRVRGREHEYERQAGLGGR
jgi:hypothetical protein